MTNKHLTILSALAALLLTASCGSDDDMTQSGTSLVELRLTSSLDAQTRATHNLDTQLAKDETLHVWVDDAGASTALYENNALTADGSGNLSGTTMYFPSTGNAVDIYGIHGNLTYTDFWGGTVTHTVATDQQSSGGSYANSDLVYGVKTNVARTSSAVLLTLNHMLSKIEVVFYQGDGAPTISKVELLNTQLEADFTPVKGSAITVTASGETGENAIVIDNDVTTTGAADADKVLNEAIIVPQTLAADTKFIRFTTSDGGELYYTIPEGGMEFEAGKKYRFNITVSLTELEVVTEIANWTDGGEVTSTAKM